MKHFDDFHEDQFDFHSYCVRKVTLRAYTGVLKWEDEVWSQQYYGRAAEGIIRIYLHLHDNPSVTAEESEPDYSKMTAAERKKAKAIARKKKKAAEKKAAEAAEKREKAQSSAQENGNKKKKPAVVDQDPNGDELLKKNPIEEAKKYSAILSKYAPKRVSTWLLQYDVAIRRGKILMALQVRAKGGCVRCFDVCFLMSFLGSVSCIKARSATSRAFLQAGGLWHQVNKLPWRRRHCQSSCCVITSWAS